MFKLRFMPAAASAFGHAALRQQYVRSPAYIRAEVPVVIPAMCWAVIRWCAAYATSGRTGTIARWRISFKRL